MTDDPRTPEPTAHTDPPGEPHATSPTVKIRYTSDPETSASGRPQRQSGKAGRIVASIRSFAREHTAGRVWWYRAPLLPILAWFFWQHLLAFDYNSILGGLNLGVHEAGHLFLGWFGSRLLSASAGTIFQVLAPIAAAIVFYRQRDVFAITVAVFWLGDSLASVAPYAADARWQILNLVSPVSGNPDHDWNTILGILGWLPYDETIATLFRWSGLLAMGAALLAAAWVLWLMATTHGPPAFISPEPGGKDEGARFREYLEDRLDD